MSYNGKLFVGDTIELVNENTEGKVMIATPLRCEIARLDNEGGGGSTAEKWWVISRYGVDQNWGDNGHDGDVNLLSDGIVDWKKMIGD